MVTITELLGITYARARIAGVAIVFGLVSACATSPEPPLGASQTGEYYRPGSGYLLGYLHRAKDPNVQVSDYPDGLRFLPPPPAAGAQAFALDEAAYRRGKALRGAPRGALAVADADLKSARAVQAFSCAMGIDISDTATPHLATLLRRSLNDAGLATFSTKEHFKRPRPFKYYKESSCTPADDAKAKDDSYPSGHAAIGMAWAQILAQIDPSRTDALMARAVAYANSRVVCGVHWASDVQWGMVAGAAAVARLQSEPLFRAQLARATDEVAAAHARGSKPLADCAGEAAAIARDAE